MPFLKEIYLSENCEFENLVLKHALDLLGCKGNAKRKSRKGNNF
jgi:hypothetical protein